MNNESQSTFMEEFAKIKLSELKHDCVITFDDKTHHLSKDEQLHLIRACKLYLKQRDVCDEPLYFDITKLSFKMVFRTLLCSYTGYTGNPDSPISFMYDAYTSLMESIGSDYNDINGLIYISPDLEVFIVGIFVGISKHLNISDAANEINYVLASTPGVIEFKPLMLTEADCDNLTGLDLSVTIGHINDRIKASEECKKTEVCIGPNLFMGVGVVSNTYKWSVHRLIYNDLNTRMLTKQDLYPIAILNNVDSNSLIKNYERITSIIKRKLVDYIPAFYVVGYGILVYDKDLFTVDDTNLKDIAASKLVRQYLHINFKKEDVL